MVTRKVSIDTPLAEITFRKYELPTGQTKREAVRKLCLSLGLLQPGDSRDVIVDVFEVVLEPGTTFHMSRFRYVVAQ